MSIKKSVSILVSVIIVAATGMTFAQEQAFQPKQLLADLKAQLQLTEEQIAELRPIMQAHSDTLKSLIEQYKEQGITGLKSLQKDLAPLRDEVKTQLDPILNDEQKQELEAFYEALRDSVNEAIRNRIITELSKKLELAEEQVEQILPILRENIEQRRKLVEKLQEQGKEGFQTFRQEYQRLQESTGEQLKAILNSEQLQKIETYQEEVREKIRERIMERRKAE